MFPQRKFENSGFVRWYLKAVLGHSSRFMNTQIIAAVVYTYVRQNKFQGREGQLGHKRGEMPPLPLPPKNCVDNIHKHRGKNRIKPTFLPHQSQTP
jgi:hypothetical protein